MVAAANEFHGVFYSGFGQINGGRINQGRLAGGLVFLIIGELIVGPVFIPVPGLIDLQYQPEFILSALRFGVQIETI